MHLFRLLVRLLAFTSVLLVPLFTAGCHPNCTPGQSVACTGPGGCAGGQVCAAEGTSFGPCQCGATMPDASVPLDAEPPVDAATPPQDLRTSPLLAAPPASGLPHAPDGTGSVTFAITKFFVGDTDPNGTRDFVNGWKNYGYDIDGVLGAANLSALCKPVNNASPSTVHAEGALGQICVIFEELKDLDNGRANYFSLYQLFTKEKDYKNALDYYVKYKISSDSLNNFETTKLITQKEIQYEYNKKALEDSIKNIS